MHLSRTFTNGRAARKTLRIAARLLVAFSLWQPYVRAEINRLHLGPQFDAAEPLLASGKPWPSEDLDLDRTRRPKYHRATAPGPRRYRIVPDASVLDRVVQIGRAHV